jgi:hypothetical protein
MEFNLSFLSVEKHLFNVLDPDHTYFERHPFISGTYIKRLAQVVVPTASLKLDKKVKVNSMIRGTMLENNITN